MGAAASRRLGVLAVAIAVTLVGGGTGACGPGKQEPPDTDSGTSGTTEPMGSATIDSASHSATSNGSMTADPVTGDPPTSTDKPVPPDTSTTVEPPSSTTEPFTSGGVSVTTATDDTTSDTTGPTGPAYGPCASLDPPTCADGLLCVVFEPSEGFEGSYCAPQCVGLQCPAGGGPQAKPECVVDPAGSMEPTHCALLCPLNSPEPGCPAGTHCEEVPNTGIGVCIAS